MVAEKPLPPVGVIIQVRLTAPGNPVLVPPVAASVGTVFVNLKLIDVGRVPAAVKFSTVLGLPNAMLVNVGIPAPFVRVMLPTTSAPPLIVPVLVGMVSVNELVVVRSLVSVKIPLTVMLLPRVTLPPVLLLVRLLKAVVFVKVCAPVPSKMTVLPVNVNVPPLLSQPVRHSLVLVMFSGPPPFMVTKTIFRLLFTESTRAPMNVGVLLGA